MNQDTTLQQEASVREARLKRRQLLRVFDTPDGREALTFLETRFQTDLPVFQGSPCWRSARSFRMARTSAQGLSMLSGAPSTRADRRKQWSQST